MSEEDLGLKLKMERALWAAGFYTRTNVRLASVVRAKGAAEPSAEDLTDVDVLGIKFAEDLTPRRVAVDCKSGKQVSPIGRTFWLAGVMKHLDADRGYVILARDIPEHQRGAAANLGVTLLQAPEISELESRYPAVPESLMVGTSVPYQYLEGNLHQLSKNLARLVGYRDTMFWFFPPTRAIAEGINITRAAMDELDLKQRFHRALLLDMAALFALATITVASYVMRLGQAEIIDTLRNLFFGGAAGVARREAMIRRIRTLLSQVSQQAELPLDDATFQLDPSYLTVVAEAVVRIMASPVEGGQAPRYLKARLLHGVLYDEWNIEEIFGAAYSPVADKLAVDLALAFLKSSGLNAGAAEALKLK